MSRIRIFLMLAISLGLAGVVSIAKSQVVLKPNGSAAVPLRAKSLNAEITIDGQFATNLLTITFQNETQERIEADFIYTLPPATLITSFAYWYGTEKVQAKVVEKEEAAAIYSHITTRMRDPALVEMIGKRTFRARIFPVMPNSDLKIEMRLVQTLSSDSSGIAYTFPLKTKKGESLDSVAVKIHVNTDRGITGVSNENGLKLSQNSHGFDLALKSKNYRPQRDLHVTLHRRKEALAASISSALIGNGNGYFALALTPNRSLQQPRVSISGVKTYQVQQITRSIARAGETLTLNGRYSGSGPAKVILSGSTSSGRVTLTAPIRFGSARVPGNLASKLWAALRIEQLSSASGNRSQVISLSKQFGMPSKFTSWLAVPAAEMKRYENEIASAKVEIYARRLAAKISRNQENGDEARRLRRQLRYWCNKAETTPESALSEQLGNEVDVLARQVGLAAALNRSSVTESKRLKARLDHLCRLTGRNLKEAVRDNLSSEAYDLSGRISILITQHQENSNEAKNLREQLNAVCRAAGSRPSDQLTDSLYGTLDRIARDIVMERHEEKPDRNRLAALESEFHRIEHAAGNSQPQMITNAESSWKYQEIERLRDLLFTEQSKKSPDAGKVKSLEARFLALQGDPTRVQRIKVHAEQAKVNREIEALSPANTVQLASLQNEKAELEKHDEELRGRMGDPLISVEAPPNTRQVIAIMPGGEIKRLVFNASTRRWEARFDIPTYAREGTYAIEIVIVLNDGRRLHQSMTYHVDLTPPTGMGRARILAGQRPTLRLEIQAGDDTARVKALLPWGETIELKPASQRHRFFALAFIPSGKARVAHSITYILTDRAHNRTTLSVDMEK